jgi:type II secretory pathway pseudopilin PulG
LNLLAVIVILAVIAIMVTPMIVSTINSAKENAVKASARNYINGIEEYIAAENAKGNYITDNTYEVSYFSKVEATGQKPTSNNYVWFNGFVWRIMGKDADGNIRMITEENVTAIPWGASNSAQEYGSSYANSWVSSYFYDHISPINQSIIKDTQFCEDSTLVTSSTSARTTCSVATVGAKGGLLSLDEYNLSGGSSSYLVNGQYYWTLTPQSTLLRGRGDNGMRTTMM